VTAEVLSRPCRAPNLGCCDGPNALPSRPARFAALRHSGAVGCGSGSGAARRGGHGGVHARRASPGDRPPRGHGRRSGCGGSSWAAGRSAHPVSDSRTTLGAAGECSSQNRGAGAGAGAAAAHPLGMRHAAMAAPGLCMQRLPGRARLEPLTAPGAGMAGTSALGHLHRRPQRFPSVAPRRRASPSRSCAAGRSARLSWATRASGDVGPLKSQKR